MAELAGGVVLIAVVIAAIVVLRGRTEGIGLLPTTLGNAPVETPASLGQLALGGTATSFPTLTLTAPPPTRTLPPPVTQAPSPSPAPTQEPAPPTITPVPQTGGPPESPETIYIIQGGDTLLAIALRNGVTLEQLMTANNIANVSQLILPGQTLKIPKDGDAAPAVPAAAPTQAPTEPAAAPTQAPAEPPVAEPASPVVIGRLVHIVRAGDSLWTIANRYGKTVDDLVALNNRTPNQFLGIGDELVIEPGVTATPPPPTATQPPPPTATQPPPTHTPVPSTATPLPTETAVPTATPEPPTATRQIALAPAVEATLAIPTPPAIEAKYRAPTLLGLPDKSGVQGKVSALLNWTSVGVLAADEYYVVRVSTVKDGKPLTEETWVKATGWRVPDTLQPSEKTASPLVYTWDVTVHRATDKTPDGKLSGPAISPTSEVYEFNWAP